MFGSSIKLDRDKHDEVKTEEVQVFKCHVDPEVLNVVVRSILLIKKKTKKNKQLNIDSLGLKVFIK